MYSALNDIDQFKENGKNVKYLQEYVYTSTQR